MPGPPQPQVSFSLVYGGDGGVGLGPGVSENSMGISQVQ